MSTAKELAARNQVLNISPQGEFEIIRLEIESNAEPSKDKIPNQSKRRKKIFFS